MFAAMPSSVAIAMPSTSVKCGAQASVVPTPPVSETEPTINPVRASMPNSAASVMPRPFWIRMKIVASSSRTTSCQPPRESVRTFEFRPSAPKKYSSSPSRTPSSKDNCRSMT